VADKRLKRIRECRKCKKIFDSQGRGYTVCDGCGGRISKKTIVPIKIQASTYQVSREYQVSKKFIDFGKSPKKTSKPKKTFPTRKPIPGIVYILGIDDFPGIYKIGFTTDKDAESRRSSCQTGSPWLLSIKGEYYCDYALDIEQELHRIFSISRLYGEWFDFRKCGGIEKLKHKVWCLLDELYGMNEYEDLRVFPTEYGPCTTEY